MEKRRLLISAMAALLAIGNAVAEDATNDFKEVCITSLTQGYYTLGEATDYSYLVVVPAKPYVEGGTQYVYHISDGTNDVGSWGFAYGYYQQRRASVFKITEKKLYEDSSETILLDNDNTSFIKALKESSIDLTKLTRLYVVNGDGDANTVVNEHEISAIYFTNEKPAYDNRFNYPISHYNYLREATAAGTYGTICLPYNAAICGAYAYKVAGVDSKDSPSKLYLEQVYGLLEAGTPYVFKTNTDKVSDLQEGYVTFYKAGASTVTTPTNSALEGNFNDNADVPQTSYVLSDGKWVKGANNTVGQYRAYLTLTNVSEISEGNAAKYISIDFGCDSTPTAISNVASKGQQDGAIYNLNGVRVSNPAKGLYIKNGKKVVIK